MRTSGFGIKGRDTDVDTFTSVGQQKPARLCELGYLTEVSTGQTACKRQLKCGTAGSHVKASCLHFFCLTLSARHKPKIVLATLANSFLLQAQATAARFMRCRCTFGNTSSTEKSYRCQCAIL